MENAEILATYGLAAVLFAIAIAILAWVIYMVWEEFF